MKKWICTVCDYIYEGDELPEDYECPLCGVGPDQFEEVQEETHPNRNKGIDPKIKEKHNRKEFWRKNYEEVCLFRLWLRSHR